MNPNALALKNKFFIGKETKDIWEKGTKLSACVIFRKEERDIYRHRSQITLCNKQNLTIGNMTFEN